MAEDLRAFAGARPSGWNHDDWVGFLTDLAAKGHDCSDPEQIGAIASSYDVEVVGPPLSV